MKVVTVEQMRAIEAAADRAGHSYAAMMEQAGHAVFRALADRLDVVGKTVLVLVGPGNNGGDGLVAARHLAQAGAQVWCYLTRPRDPQEDENFRRLGELGVPSVVAGEDRDGETLQRWASAADGIVDGLLGTGAGLPVKGAVADVLRTVGAVLEQRARPATSGLVRLGGGAESTAPTRPLIVAVDGPSGLDFDSGALDAAALPAELTVTFAYPKQGHFRFPGAAAVGELWVADIGIDPALTPSAGPEVVTVEMAQRFRPARPPDAHKGSFGRALVVAGSASYVGAARLAGAAAVRAGAGLVTMALPATIHSAVAAGLAEATYLLLPQRRGAIAPLAAGIIVEQGTQYDALLLGPGLGRSWETANFVTRLLTEVGRQSTFPPLIVDADGLNILAGLPDWPARLPAGTVLTPHPGEMARLMNCSTAAVQANRVETARRQAQAWGCVVVLKGAYTVVAGPDGAVALEPFANHGLATGGTGDVLAGIIVALRAQGLAPFAAAVVGAYVHGLAGEVARSRLGAPGMAAGDLVTFLPEAWKSLGTR